MAKEKKNLAVVPPKETTLVISPEEELEMFGESEIDMSDGFSFNPVAIVKDTAQFDMGNEVYEKTLTGHVLYRHRASQWWRVKFDDRGPDDDPRPGCYSTDSIKPCGGPERQAETCATCKWDKFKSDRKGGKGKDCRNTMRFLFLRDGEVMPIVLTAPPTSLNKNPKKGPLQKWLNGVAGEVATAYNAVGRTTKNKTSILDYWWAHVELSLEKRDFNGLPASILVVKTLDILTPEIDLPKTRTIYSTMKDGKEMYLAQQAGWLESETSEPNAEPETDAARADADGSDYADDNPI